MRRPTPETGTKAVPTYRLDSARVASIDPPKGRLMDRRSRDVLNENCSYHICNGANVGGIVQTVDAIAAFAREHGPGCYAVDVHFTNPLVDTFDVFKTWGKVIHHRDGKVAIYIDPISDPK